MDAGGLARRDAAGGWGGCVCVCVCVCVCGGGRWVEAGGVEGSVTDSHLVPVARAARVVPLSAVAFDGLSCLSSFLKKI